MGFGMVRAHVLNPHHERGDRHYEGQGSRDEINNVVLRPKRQRREGHSHYGVAHYLEHENAGA